MKLNKITFHCSICNTLLSVPDQGGGKHTVDTFCPTCGRKFFLNLFLTEGLLKIEVNADRDLYNFPRIKSTHGGRVLSMSKHKREL